MQKQWSKQGIRSNWASKMKFDNHPTRISKNLGQMNHLLITVLEDATRPETQRRNTDSENLRLGSLVIETFGKADCHWSNCNKNMHWGMPIAWWEIPFFFFGTFSSIGWAEKIEAGRYAQSGPLQFRTSFSSIVGRVVHLSMCWQSMPVKLRHCCVKISSHRIAYLNGQNKAWDQHRDPCLTLMISIARQVSIKSVLKSQKGHTWYTGWHALYTSAGGLLICLSRHGAIHISASDHH